MTRMIESGGNAISRPRKRIISRPQTKTVSKPLRKQSTSGLSPSRNENRDADVMRMRRMARGGMGGGAGKVDGSTKPMTAGMVGGMMGGGSLTKEQREHILLRSFEQGFEHFDNPGGGKTDGIVSKKDLEKFAEGDYNREAVMQSLEASNPEQSEDLNKFHLKRLEVTAQSLLDNPDLLKELDTASARLPFRDNKISKADLQAGVLANEKELVESGQRLKSSDTGILPGEFEIPTEDEVYSTAARPGEERSKELATRQETAILENLNSGKSFDFTNSSGETEQLRVSQLKGTTDKPIFRMEDADGNHINIESHLDGGDTRIALARLADYYTQTPEMTRDALETVRLFEGSAPKRDDGLDPAATYSVGRKRINFYKGLRYVNEGTFDHEFGHALADREFGKDLAPPEWEAAAKLDGRNPTEYGATKNYEDFAESWTTFVQAAEKDTDKLDEFQELYPNRFAILEDMYLKMDDQRNS